MRRIWLTNVLVNINRRLFDWWLQWLIIKLSSYFVSIHQLIHGFSLNEYMKTKQIKVFHWPEWKHRGQTSVSVHEVFFLSCSGPPAVPVWTKSDQPDASLAHDGRDDEEEKDEGGGQRRTKRRMKGEDWRGNERKRERRRRLQRLRRWERIPHGRQHALRSRWLTGKSWESLRRGEGWRRRKSLDRGTLTINSPL